MHSLRSVLVLSAALVSLPAAAGDDLSLDALLGMKVTTASKKAERLEDAPGVMTVITKDDIADYGRRDLFEVMELVVGSFETQNSLFPRNFPGVRGDDSFRANHMLFLLNGRPLRRSIDGGYNAQLLRSFPIETVERVEVIRGPGSVLYGSTAYQGVVNIITRTPSDPEAGASVGYGSWNTFRGRGHAGYAHPSGLTVLAGVSAIDSDGALVEQVDRDNVPGSWNLYTEDVAGTLQLSYKGFDVNWVGATGTAPSFSDAGVWDNRSDWKQQRAMLDAGWGHDVNDWLSVQTNVTWNYALQSNPDAAFVDVAADVLEDGSSTAKSNDYLVEASAYLTPHERFNMLVGTSVERQTGYWLIGDPNKPGVNTGLLAPYGEQWGAVFTQADYRPVDNVKLVFGAQANKAGDVPWDLVPRLGVVAHANDNFGVKVLTGQAFRASYHFERSFKINDLLLPNDNLSPEKITTLDAQAFVNVGSFKGSVNVFQSEQANLIDFETVQPGVFRQSNMPGTLVSRGIEVEARGKPVVGLETFGSFSLFRYWQVDEEAPQITQGVSVPVPVRWNVGEEDRTTFQAPSYMLKGGAAYTHHRGLTASAFATWQSPSDANYGREELTGQPDLENWDKPFFDIDARLQADVSKLTGLSEHPIKVGVNARNLLDQKRYTAWNSGMWQMQGGREVMVDLEVAL